MESSRVFGKKLWGNLSFDAELLPFAQKRGHELAEREEKSPSYDESLVQKADTPCPHQMISDWLDEHSDEIRQGKIRVLVEDECHLKGGDICSRAWADRKQRLDVKVKNYLDSKTYYGALDCRSGQMLLQSYSTADTTSTIKFIQELLAQDLESKIVLIWDGASHHRSKKFREFLTQINRGEDWKVHCLRLAPYAPKENPIENVWGQLKQTLRLMYLRCSSFKFTTLLFEMLVKHQLFSFPDISEHAAFSNLI